MTRKKCLKMHKNRFYRHLELENFLGAPPHPLTRGVIHLSYPPPPPPPPPHTHTHHHHPSHAFDTQKNGYDVPWPYHFSKADDGPVRSNITLFGRSNLNTNKSFFLLPRVIRITLDGQNLPVRIRDVSPPNHFLS